MVLVGIDIGTNEIRVAHGETFDEIINNITNIKLENVISFIENKRIYGTNAKKNLYNQYGTNTFVNLKWFLGKLARNERLKSFIEHSPCYVEQLFTNDELNHRSKDDMRLFFNTSSQYKYFNNCLKLYPDEIYIMIIAQVKNLIISGLFLENDEPVDCVISVPINYNFIEREILSKCCSLAGLNCLNFCNDTTAICLYYAVTKKNLLSSEPKILIVIDLGATSLQIAYIAVWDGGFKVLHTFSVNDFGGQNFDYELFAKTRTSKSLEGFEEKMGKSLFKSSLLRECEKGKLFGFNSSFEMRLNKDCSLVIYKEDFEQAYSEMFFAFAKYLRTSYDEFAKRFNLPSHDPAKAEPLNILISGGTMKIPKLKEIVRQVFKMEPKYMNKDIIAKGCLLYAEIIINNKKDFQINENLLQEIVIQSERSLCTLVKPHSSLPAKLLIRNVDFSEKYFIYINKDILYGTVKIKMKDEKKKPPNSTNWKIIIKTSGIIEKIMPIFTKIDDLGKEIVDTSVFSFTFKPSDCSATEKELAKIQNIFNRLENYEDEGSAERLELQNFIFQSINYMNQISEHLPNEKVIEVFKLLEDEEKWLMNNEAFTKHLCINKLELLKKRINSVQTQKELYDNCVERLNKYKKSLDNGEKLAQMSHLAHLNGSQYAQNEMNSLQYKIFTKMLEEHREFYDKFSKHLSHENILALIVSPESIEQKIKIFEKESNLLNTQISKQNEVKIEKTPKIIETNSYNRLNDFHASKSNLNDDNYCPPIFQKTKKHVNFNPQVQNHVFEKVKNYDDNDDNDDKDQYYQVLNNGKIKSSNNYVELKLPLQERSVYASIDEQTTERDASTERKLKKTSLLIKSIAIKGAEISYRGTVFNLRLQNFKGIQFPNEWEYDIKMDRKEYRVLLDPKSKEFQTVEQKFQQMIDSQFDLIDAWRIQNENLWANYYMRKSRMKQPNELEVFYGCDGAYFKHVCENNCQFRRSTFKCPDYGLGVYFYRNSTDAHKNVKPYYGYYYMFICKIVVGKSILGTTSNAKLPKGIHCATNRKSLNNSTIFVLPKENSDQVYPFYLLAYHSN